jgi:hypothetical protein
MTYYEKPDWGDSDVVPPGQPVIRLAPLVSRKGKATAPDEPSILPRSEPNGFRVSRIIGSVLNAMSVLALALITALSDR